MSNSIFIHKLNFSHLWILIVISHMNEEYELLYLRDHMCKHLHDTSTKLNI